MEDLLCTANSVSQHEWFEQWLDKGLLYIVAIVMFSCADEACAAYVPFYGQEALVQTENNRSVQQENIVRAASFTYVDYRWLNEKVSDACGSAQ